jgi:hypothetical protein
MSALARKRSPAHQIAIRRWVPSQQSAAMAVSDACLVYPTVAPLMCRLIQHVALHLERTPSKVVERRSNRARLEPIIVRLAGDSRIDRLDFPER